MTSYAVHAKSRWTPNPCPARGTKFQLDTNGELIAYGCGSTVVIRNVANPVDSKVYIGHKKDVQAVRFSRDGKLLASGDACGVISVFNPDDMTLLKESTALPGSIFDLAFDHTGSRLAACADVAKGVGNSCFMWKSGTLQGDLAGNSKRVLAIDIRPNAPSRLAVGGEDFKVKLHNGPPYKFTHSFDGHKNFVQSLRYSPGGNLLATCGSDQKIFLLDAETGMLKSTLPGLHKGSVYAVSWSEDEKHLISCSADKTVCLWDIGAEKLIHQFKMGNQMENMQMGCAYATRQPLSVSLSGDLNYLDVNSGKTSKVFHSYTSLPLHLAVDQSSGKGDLYVGTSKGDVLNCAANGNATFFANSGVGSNDGVVANNGRLWSVGHDDCVRGAKASAERHAFTSSYSLGAKPTGVASCMDDPDLCVVVTEETVQLFRDGVKCDSKVIKRYRATCVGMSTDGKQCTVGGSDLAGHVFRIHDDILTETDTILREGHNRIIAIAYSVKGQVAMATNAKVISLWDAAWHEKIHDDRWVFHGGSVNCLSFSPSGNHLVSGGSDCQIIVWNTSSKSAKTKMEWCHFNGVNSVEWLDDNTIVSSGNDGCICKWAPKLP